MSHVRYDLGNGETVLTTEEEARAADFDREMHGMCVFVLDDGIGARLPPEEWPAMSSAVKWYPFTAEVAAELASIETEPLVVTSVPRHTKA